MKHFLLSLGLLTMVSIASAIDVESTLSKFNASDYEARQASRLALRDAFASATAPNGNSTEAKAIETALMSAIGSDYPLESRLYLIRLLEWFGSEQSVEALYPLLGDESFEVRDSARRALAANSGPLVAGYLTTGLKKGPAEARAAYVDALVYNGVISAAPEIAKLLRTDNPDWIRSAAVALGELGDPASLPALRAAHASVSQDLKCIVEAAMLDVGVDADTASMLAVEGSNRAVRSAAFLALCERDSERAGQLLQTVLKDPAFKGQNRFVAIAMKNGSAKTQQYLVENLDKMSFSNQLVVVSLIGSLELTQYEAKLLAMLPSATGDLYDAAMDTLAYIGGDASFEIIYKAFEADSRNQSLSSAVSRLKAPGADEKALETAKNSPDPQARITAMRILELRNAPGATALLNSIAQSSSDMKVRQAAFKSLEAIGNTESARILAELIVAQDPTMKPAQVSLKRMSLNFGAPDVLFDSVYRPALQSAGSDDAREGLIVILDGVQCDETLTYIKEIATGEDSKVKTAAIRNLERWSDFSTGDVWLEIATAEGATEANISKAGKALKKILSDNNRKKDQIQITLAVKAIEQGPNVEFKQTILSAYDKPIARQKSKLRKEFKQLTNDPDVGESVQQLIAKL